MNGRDALKALKEFFIYVQANCTASNTQLLYYTLMQINNRTGWLDEFQCANTNLSAIMGISEKSLIKNRNNLIQLGFIEVRRPRSKRGLTIYKILYPTKYSTNQFCTQQNTGQSSAQSSGQSSGQTSGQSSGIHIHNTNTNTLNSLSYSLPLQVESQEKPNKITAPKRKKAEEKAVKHKYGEYNNVLLSDEDIEKLKNEFACDYQERIERLSEYIASTGKVYKSHLATIRMWARKDQTTGTSMHKQPKTDPGDGKVTWADFPNASDADRICMTPETYKKRMDSLKNMEWDRTGGVF